jgi:hypothetical protein
MMVAASLGHDLNQSRPEIEGTGDSSDSQAGL